MIVPATITTVRRLDNCGRFHTAWTNSGHSRRTAIGQKQTFDVFGKTRAIHWGEFECRMWAKLN
ncbi:hypothetical protein DOH45_24345 [Salmonella enterica subsp. enterica serovar Enteritidis]|nr:hypothetical protein [Salmonella enterica subsp. enterica serovar Enteritidis]